MLRYFLAPIFWACTILFFSSIPAKDLPDFSFWQMVSFDKLVHITMYGLLSFLVMKGMYRQYSSWYLRYNSVKITTVLVTVYGGAIELYQEYFLVDRTGQWFDFAANIIGAILGIWVFRLIFFEYIR